MSRKALAAGAAAAPFLSLLSRGCKEEKETFHVDPVTRRKGVALPGEFSGVSEQRRRRQ